MFVSNIKYDLTMKVFHPSKKKNISVNDGFVYFHKMGIMSVKNSDIQQNIRTGFPIHVFDVLKEQLNLSQETILDIIGISKSTLNRRRKNKRFNSIESDRFYRIVAIYLLVLKLFNGDNDGTKGWFARPVIALGDEVPISQLDTQVGAEKVRDLIGRLEHGVFT